MIYNPPLTKRYAMVLPVGSPGQFGATQAWLWVTDPTAVTRQSPSRHGVPLAMGRNRLVLAISRARLHLRAESVGLFVVHKVEDLYTKFTRPF